MSVTSLGSLTGVDNYSRLAELGKENKAGENRNASFEALFQSAVNMINDTNNLTNAAEEEEIKLALGLTNNVHDLQVAQQKANLSLQYTVAVRNKVLDVYKEIMNMQF